VGDVWGNRIKLSLFGESHGPAIGVVIDGLPPGLAIDLEAMEAEMGRRAPGKSATATARREADRVEIVSGFFEGRTTGTALCGLVYNKDTRSRDYSQIKRYARPGHADFTGNERYRGFQDYRGGGHFSGRLTAPVVFAGAVCKQFLSSKGIQIYGHAKQIGGIVDTPVDPVTPPQAGQWGIAQMREIPVLDENAGEKMRQAILAAKAQGDSVGGVVEIVVTGLPAGLGNPFFDSVESAVAHLAFSIPAVKGIEFGSGFDMAAMKGSEANDPMYVEDGQIHTRTNRNGGLLGGITSGMPLIFSVAIKPTPSISVVQETVDLERREDAKLVVEGRHDPCIVPRAVPVLEAVAAIALADYMV